MVELVWWWDVVVECGRIGMVVGCGGRMWLWDVVGCGGGIC